MRTIITTLFLALNVGYAHANGLTPTSFYFLPLKSVAIDRDALAAYTPGGSVGVHTSGIKTIYSLTWADSAITISQQVNDIQSLKADYGRFIDLAPEMIRKEVATAMECSKLLKVEVTRAGFPTIVQTARQIILCDKLQQLTGGFILTYQGVFYPDGKLICGDSAAPANLFIPPPKP